MYLENGWVGGDSTFEIYKAFTKIRLNDTWHLLVQGSLQVSRPLSLWESEESKQGPHL